MMLTTSRFYVQLRLGDARLISVDPRKINFHVGTNEPMSEPLKQRMHVFGKRIPALRKPMAAIQALIGQSDSWIIASQHYRQPKPIELEDRHCLIADFLTFRDEPQKSAWYEKLTRELAETGEARHKEICMRSKAEIEAFLEFYVLGMISSLETTGYDPARAPDSGTALIGADGTIHKTHNGNHRFCAARLLGVKNVPLKILGAHEDWVKRQSGEHLDFHRLRAALKDVAIRFA